MKRIASFTYVAIGAILLVTLVPLSHCTGEGADPLELLTLRNRITDLETQVRNMDSRIRDLELVRVIRESPPPHVDLRFEAARQVLWTTASEKGWDAALALAIDPAWQQKMHLDLSQAATLCRGLHAFARNGSPPPKPRNPK